MGHPAGTVSQLLFFFFVFFLGFGVESGEQLYCM
jgi:hypothetical protein